jgi:CAAX protease family protein
VREAMARHPVAAFLLIGIGGYVAAVLILTPVDNDVLPFELPLYGVLGGIIGVALAAFLVSYATDGRAGVADLARRSVRWRVAVRWYLLALFAVPVAAALDSPHGGWPRALGAVAVVFVLQLVLFQLPEEIGWTGFLQDRWQDRYSPLGLSAMVALP